MASQLVVLELACCRSASAETLRLTLPASLKQAQLENLGTQCAKLVPKAALLVEGAAGCRCLPAPTKTGRGDVLQTAPLRRTSGSPATCGRQSRAHHCAHHVNVHLQHIHRRIPHFVVCCIDQDLIEDLVKAGGEADVPQHHVAAIVDPQLVILLLSAAQQQERL